MERRGIGRPSTYAPTIATLKEHNYVELIKGKVQPTTMGLQVDDFLIRQAMLYSDVAELDDLIAC
jgi:DNA topoisomerase I